MEDSLDTKNPLELVDQYEEPEGRGLTDFPFFRFRHPGPRGVSFGGGNGLGILGHPFDLLARSPSSFLSGNGSFEQFDAGSQVRQGFSRAGVPPGKGHSPRKRSLAR
jgi:hypothetical protein